MYQVWHKASTHRILSKVSSVSIGQRVNPRDMCFSSYATKENLIEIITQELFVRYRNIVSSHRLVITSKNEVPQELHQTMSFSGRYTHL